MTESSDEKSVPNGKDSVAAPASSGTHQSKHNHKDNTLRYRRTKSVTRAEEITTKEQKQRKSQPDKPYVFFVYVGFLEHSLHIALQLNTKKKQ